MYINTLHRDDSFKTKYLEERSLAEKALLDVALVDDLFRTLIDLAQLIMP